MYDYICPALVTRVFPTLPPQGGRGDIHVTETMRVDDGLEVVGIGFADLRYVMFFADVPEDLADEPAGQAARFVTVVRVEADHGTMFLPDFWRLPCPHMVWQFSEALLQAMRHHVDAHPSVQQYVCVSQTRKMDFLCERVIRQFTRTAGSAQFRCVTRPDADRTISSTIGKEGRYGFARHESCSA
jgi:hypothetical protein